MHEHSSMTTDSIDVHVFEQFEQYVTPETLELIAGHALVQVPERSAHGLDVVIADDETVRELNKLHRGLDENTDVLSFSFDHQGEYYGDEAPASWQRDEVEFVMPPGERQGLGEVIISYPQVARQAEQAGRPVEQELAHMLIHGILHLLGYDHMEPEDEAAMKDLESRALAQVFKNE